MAALSDDDITTVRARPAQRSRERSRAGQGRDLLRLVLIPTLVIGAMYALPFVLEPASLPFGADTLGYIWRTDVARTLGFEALRPDVFPPPIQPLGNRPAYPAVAGVLDTIVGVRPFTFAWLSPALLAVVAGLAAGVVAVEGLREPTWRGPLYAIGMGSSVLIAWTAVGYAANLMLDGTSLAIAAVVLLMPRRRASWPVAAILLACAALIHWMFASVFAAILLAYAGAAVSARALRRSSRVDTVEADTEMPSPRALGSMLLVGCLAGALVLFALPPEIGLSPPNLSVASAPRSVSVKLQARDSAIITWAGVPLAIAALVAAFRTWRRWPALLLGIWASLALVGGVAWWVLRLPAPPYRWTAFALGLPMLAIAAGPWAGDALAGRVGPVARRIGAATALLVSVALVAGGANYWWGQRSHTSVEQRLQLDTITRYVEALPSGTPISILVSRGGRLPFDSVFSGLPAERLPDIDLIAAPPRWDRPGYQPQATLPGGVVLAPSTYLKADAPIGTEIGPGVSLLVGPPPATTLPAPVAPRAPSAPRLAWYLVLALAGLWLAGVGWAALLRMRVVSRIAIAPALGMSMMALVGTSLGRLGVRPSGPGALLILGVTTLTGVIAAVIAREPRALLRSFSGPRNGAERGRHTRGRAGA